MNISKIIHHIAPADRSRWHPVWERCYPSWQEQFPDFEHRMWSDRCIDDLVKQKYPKYWEMYNQFSAHIMKIDFARFCILHTYGGIYADMDMYCFKNFEEHINDYEISVFKTDICLLCGIPNHKFWEDCYNFYCNACINYTNIDTGNSLKTISSSLDEDLPEKSRKLKDKILTIMSNTIKYAILKNTKINILPIELFDNCTTNNIKNSFTTHVYTGTWVPDYKIESMVDLDFFYNISNDT